MKTFTFEFNHWHLWESVNGYLLSDENTKQLYSFVEVGHAVNWLYVNDAKDAARALNTKQLEHFAE